MEFQDKAQYHLILCDQPRPVKKFARSARRTTPSSIRGPRFVAVRSANERFVAVRSANERFPDLSLRERTSFRGAKSNDTQAMQRQNP